ncbi:MAG TPA: hypothetical protein DD381_09625 [Lentisphaeria bacterium]|nr:MAG: hypothetical protein A2X47_07500 [Lentisphaerae bacterium GWF2_38_69]HBM16583.1 hypothetical protein [Lentisphaeria bacterium]
MPYLELNDLNIYYELKGLGAPLVLVPGLSGTCDTFSLVSNAFAKDFTVVSLDNRGSGRSFSQTKHFTIQNMAEDLASLVNLLEFDKINLLGHSMGGFIVQEYVNKYPDKVDKIILSNTSRKCSYRNKDIFQCLIKLIKNADYLECWHRMFSQWIYTDEFINNNPRSYESAISYSLHYPYAQCADYFEAQALACANYKTTVKDKNQIPSLILYGDKDKLITPEESLELLNYFPNSKKALMKRSGHIPMIENKEEYSEIIIDFLNP